MIHTRSHNSNPAAISAR